MSWEKVDKTRPNSALKLIVEVFVADGRRFVMHRVFLDSQPLKERVLAVFDGFKHSELTTITSYLSNTPIIK